MATPRKILVIKWRAMGDTVMLSSSLLALRAALPKVQIDVCCTAAWSPLLEGHPAIHRLIPFERRTTRRARLRSIMRTGFELRREKYDAVLNFHASPSSAALALSVGAPVRAVHFHGHKDRNRYSTVEIPGKGILKPILERDLDVVRALGLRISSDHYWPKIFLNSLENDEADQSLKALNLNGPVLGLGLGASRPTKTWDLSRYVQLSQQWIQKTGGSVLAVLGPDENAIAGRFKALLAGLSTQEASSIVLQNDLPIRSLAKVLSRIAVFVGNDSGPRHLAAAVGIPTLTLFGPEDPFEWHPYAAARHPRIFIENLACRKDGLPGYPAWCGIQECVTEKHRCLSEISVTQVIAQLKSLMPTLGKRL